MTHNSLQKFGGSSMSQPQRSAEIFMDNPERNRIAVVSAVGKNPDDPGDTIKTTDWLIALEHAADQDDRIGMAEAEEAVIAKTRAAYSMLGEHTLARVCDNAHRLMQLDQRNSGYQWIGEHISAQLFSTLTGAVHVSPGLRFSGGILQLHKSIEEIQKAFTPALKTGRQIVSEGFFGYDVITGRITTLKRGGSDTSAVITTGAIGQTDQVTWVHENYTDRDGVFSTDPDLVPEAVVIREATHEEMREKMHGITERNGVVHGDAIAYAARLGVEMYVRNTFNADAPGTKIAGTRQSNPDKPIIGISGKSNMTVLDAYDMGMADAENYLARILAKVGESGMSISNIPTGEDRIKLVFNGRETEEKLHQVRDFVLDNAISGDRAEATIQHNQGAVYLVGQELTDRLAHTKVLGEVASVLSSNNLGIKEIVSHEKSPSMVLMVEGEDVKRIVRLLHEALI